MQSLGLDDCLYNWQSPLSRKARYKVTTKKVIKKKHFLKVGPTIWMLDMGTMQDGLIPKARSYCIQWVEQLELQNVLNELLMCKMCDLFSVSVCPWPTSRRGVQCSAGAAEW